eukprot:759832-Hanusia_phi.AAC.4
MKLYVYSAVLYRNDAQHQPSRKGQEMARGGGGGGGGDSKRMRRKERDGVIELHASEREDECKEKERQACCELAGWDRS